MQASLLTNSSNVDIFNNAAMAYHKASNDSKRNALLKTESGICSGKNTRKPKIKDSKKRRNMIYTPYSVDIKNNVGKILLNLMVKHLANSSYFKKIFHKNNF